MFSVVTSHFMLSNSFHISHIVILQHESKTAFHWSRGTNIFEPQKQ
jgi:hypothetical protein